MKKSNQEATKQRWTFSLPLPPSPNRRPSDRMHAVRWKNTTKRLAWLAANEQHAALTKPPAFVRIHAHFRIRNLRDEDNLVASLKYVLDALRLPRGKETVTWRHGIAENKGYLVDDSPTHCQLGQVTQELDRKDPGLVLTIEDIEPGHDEGRPYP
jgi:hypothetical protein